MYLYCSVTKSCPTHCNPIDCSTAGFPVLHYIPELAQAHVHWVRDAIQPSYPLLPTSPLFFFLINLFFNWRIITLQNFVVFCQTSTWISHSPLLLLPSTFPSIRVLSNESTLCMRWPTYWSFSFSISPSNEHVGLIFRMDWLDLLAVQGTLKSLLQHHSSKASKKVLTSSLMTTNTFLLSVVVVKTEHPAAGPQTTVD